MAPPRVLSCLPDRTYLKATEVSEIRLRFSTSMEPQSTEEAFSLKANATTQAGTFHWEDGNRILVFLPISPLKDKGAYVVSVSTGAEDRWGNSLQEEFHHSFYTKEETEPPRVVTSFPPSGVQIAQPLQPIEITFSEPMDPESILLSFSLTPPIPGVFSFSANSRSFTWSPMEPYRQGETYQVTLKKDAQDTSGNCLPEDYRFSFQVPKTEAKLLSITCLSHGALLTPTPGGTYVDPSLQIEKNETFKIRFTTPLDPETRDSVLTFYPATPYRMDWNSTGDEVLLSFSEPLVWNTVYELQVLSSTYRFRVNGPQSVPPEVRRILYIPDTTAVPPTYEELFFCQNYGFTASFHAAFDVYISLALDASLITSSFLSSFSIEAGSGCMDLDLLRVEESPVSPPPQPVPPLQDGGIPLKVQVFRVYCRITPVLSSGTVTFTVRKDLQDTLGNHLTRPYTLIINKQ